VSERGRLLVGGVMVLGLAGLVTLAGSREPDDRPEPASSTTVDRDPVQAAAAALADWGRFAVSGDLDAISASSASFDPAGPQYQLLTIEAGALSASGRGDPPYAFTVEVVEVRAGEGEEQVVRAEVTMSRPGESIRRFNWDLVMRQVAGRWLLWTVEEWS